MVTINIATLGEGSHEVELEPGAEDLGLDSGRFDAIRVVARLNYFDGRIVANIDVSTSATLECDRTLRLFQQQLGGSYLVLFAPADEVEAGAEEIEDVRILEPWQREIDVTDIVRDTVLLSVPVRCVAPGAEEMEIQTSYGESKSETDPRWEALAKLRAERTADES